MSQPLLSILIPTVYGREKSLLHLQTVLQAQIQELYSNGVINSFDDIEVVVDIDNKETPIGRKRETLYKISKCRFSWMIDDDDSISGRAIEKIIASIKSNPAISCITFREKCLINGEYKSSNHSIKYDDWHDNFDGFDFVRTPFYKDVIRTDIAKSVPFEHIRWGEDHAWSKAVKPLLIDEIHIDEEIYHYIHNSTDPTERYGLDK